MTNFKKRFKRIGACLLTVAVLGTSTVPALAANTENRDFSFSVKGAYAFTAARAKTNKTAVYVKIKSGQKSAYVQTYGNTIDSKGNTVWMNYTQYQLTVTAKPGIDSSIHTLIYENGCSQARLRGRAVSESSTTKGVWSPDSTKNYNFSNSIYRKD